LLLLLLAYTNRFLSLAHWVRGLKARCSNAAHAHICPQIHNLQQRLVLLHNTQAAGPGSMFVRYAGWQQANYVLPRYDLARNSDLGWGAQ
jgi:hypothetical protein